MNKIIECQALNYSYQNNKVQTPVLSALNLVVHQSESLAIIGESGCGKSTLLNLLGGMSRPSTGKVMVNGFDLSQLNEEKVTLLRAQHLGFVYQFHHLLKDFSALDNVAMPLLIRGDDMQTAIKKSSKILADIGLQDRLNHKPAELSGGQRQRVAIARALINKPSCLLADEPTGNLDAKSAKEVLGLMMELNQQQKSALILVTHDMSIAKQMDRFLTLKNGTLI
ncbi:Lipoprotein releasing system ATP-binding protein LolD [Bathymodiolus thermophilus thioautotrophic gill symbiont]|uniref:Lipoprotein ABC transporter ATP-binding protein LolD n=1 Tax=Bathymodiolus thermophilus thioautotrophic gill symbiont TaxID=2360 RepID=A0A1J5TWI3_9GAMM|nr:ABC transporter ATP-binding protein [Bathymodiolus thermophilus thioautotrophic gill symbiont]AYQ57396.1 lipoprotein-releasing system ATP-binding protein [Bathymodiolus thermophilus thioautotrophic gill symbiont]OIR25114.1 lipoprotein ABC transporter ATP-binding protein LolD [Bathymodiolus thermophilus thioautotrophic gill symbiont]CAB5495162.1 Lipoprotein-releasing system ATP-binding protein LolD [Bathymodiolus thermophilus thioautotrophic gill symbiont]CAB5504229.1 Lipoprotein-releasing sy